jgi:hypothetical protein
MVVNERTLPPWARDSRVRVGLIVAVAVVVAIVVWLLVRDNDNGSSSSAVATGPAIGPVAATQDRLRRLADDEGHDVYWIGPENNTTYELTRTSAGRIFVRYLPKGVPIGVDRADYTIVGTYPVPNATSVLQGLAQKSGENKLSVPNGGIAVYSSSQPTNVYVAYPGSNLQIEVFDPSADRAQRLVTSGQLEPVR